MEKGCIKVDLSPQTDACVEPTAITNFRDLLTAHPNMDAVYSICGPDGMAVAQVLSERPKGSKPVICSSWDIEDQQLRDIVDGRCDAAIVQLPVKLGMSAVIWAVKVARRLASVTDLQPALRHPLRPTGHRSR